MLKTFFLFFFSFCFINSFCQLNENAINASFTEFTSFIESINNKIIVDARPEEEFGEGGFIGAISVSTKTLLLNFIDNTEKSIPILVYCNEGQRSIAVCNMLIENGFKTVINLEEGILKHKEQIGEFNKKLE